jgi:drug/metabolite transporter (DMT)-like permease
VGVILLVSTQIWMLIFTKRATTAHRLPMLLCLAQFALSAVLSGAGLLLRRRQQLHRRLGLQTQQQQSTTATTKTPRSDRSSSSSSILSLDTLWLVLPLTISWTLGFVLFNAAASRMSPAHVNLIRCGEPLATVAVGTMMLPGRRDGCSNQQQRRQYSLPALLTLVPIVGGVALASAAASAPSSSQQLSGSDGGLSAIGVVTACLSTVSFCVRPFCLERLQGAVQDLDLFFHVTVLASMTLPWIVLLLEGRKIGHALFDQPVDMVFAVDVTLSSVCFFLYQYLQLRVMVQLSPLSFSVLTPVVKAVMIVACSLYFGDPFGWYSLLGVLTTTGGGYLFSVFSKSDAKHPPPLPAIHQKPAP